MPGAEVKRPTEVVPEAPGAPAFLLALYLLVSCTTVVLAHGGPSGAIGQLRWFVVLSDVGLGLVVLAHVRQLPALWRDWRRHRCALAAGALAVSLLPSLAVHPSARGDAAVLRWLGVAVIAFAVGRLAGASRVLVLGVFASVTVVQVVIALAERAGNGPIGLQFLGEPYFGIGGRFASSGLTVHPYVLAAWCTLGSAVLLVAVARAERAPGALTVAAVAPFVGVGLTMSRAGLLGLVLVLICLGVAALRQPRLRVVVAGAVVATAVGIVLDLSGWVSRASDTSSAATLSSNRGQLFRQAWGLFHHAPVFGVGPGRYVEALVRRPDLVKLATQTPSRPVHMVPYLVLVEGGIFVLPALLFLAWAIMTQSWRAGVLGVGVTLAVVPFLLLDHLNWSYPQGLLLTGLWLGTLDQINIPQPGRGTGRYL